MSQKSWSDDINTKPFTTLLKKQPSKCFICLELQSFKFQFPFLNYDIDRSLDGFTYDCMHHNNNIVLSFISAFSTWKIHLQEKVAHGYNKRWHATRQMSCFGCSISKGGSFCTFRAKLEENTTNCKLQEAAVLVWQMWRNKKGGKKFSFD